MRFFDRLMSSLTESSVRFLIDSRVPLQRSSVRFFDRLVSSLIESSVRFLIDFRVS